LLRTQGLPITLFDLSRAASLAIVQAVIHWTAGKITPSLKWPNDIWVDGRKLGGILIENRWNGQGLEWSVIGLGLNVNQTVFAEGLAATSLKLLTGETLFVEEGAYTMQKALTDCLEKINTVSALRMEYESLLVGFGQENYFTEPDGAAFMGRIIGTTPEGLLCIESKTGTRFFDIKEIQQGL
jgi:BirA family biotin operon repressor/biotin-[acetyl-CoA-carboxylase] ligase